jgi:hypothetical protein
MSAKHICLCTHVQGFHWDDGVGKCADAECSCEAFDEDVFTSALPPPTANAAKHDVGGDALARAMRLEEEREVSDDEAWDRGLHADRPRPTGKPRPSTLRELGGSPEDLTG